MGISEDEVREIYSAYVLRHRITAVYFAQQVRLAAGPIFDHEQTETDIEISEPSELIAASAIIGGLARLLAEKLLLLEGRELTPDIRMRQFNLFFFLNAEMPPAACFFWLASSSQAYVPRPAASGRSRSLRCSASPRCKRSRWFAFWFCMAKDLPETSFRRARRNATRFFDRQQQGLAPLFFATDLPAMPPAASAHGGTPPVPAAPAHRQSRPRFSRTGDKAPPCTAPRGRPAAALRSDS